MAKVSDMVIAMQGWETSFATSTGSPSGSFGIRAIVKTNGVTLDNNELDIAFDVPFDDDTEANEAVITVYNLSKTTVSSLKRTKAITITAGYQNDTGVIFSGYINKVQTKWSGMDKVTTIYAIDSHALTEYSINSISYAAGTNASYILRQLIDKLYLPVAVFSIANEYTYKDGTTVSGGLMSNIKQFAQICGVSAYVLKGKVYVRSLQEGDNSNFLVSADTGLLGEPEEFEERIDNGLYAKTITGVKCKMLLQHRITTASIFRITSKDVNGTFRVREGKHVYNGTDFYTEVTAI